MATKRPRYMISVDNDMFNEIENFRFKNRFQTRSEATAALIRLGLDTLKEEKSMSNTDSITVLKAARSTTHKPIEKVIMSKEQIDKIQNAPTISDDDL